MTRMIICTVLIFSFTALPGICQEDATPIDAPEENYEPGEITGDHSFNIGFDASAAALFSMLNITSDIYLTQHIAVNNNLVFYHDRIPSLTKTIVSAVSEVCCTLLSAMTLSGSGSYEASFYSDNFNLMYLASISIFIEKYKGIYLGAGTGPQLFFDSTANQSYLGIFILLNAGYQFFSNTGFFTAVEFEYFIPAYWFPEMNTNGSNFFGIAVPFMSLHIGYMP